MTSAWIGGLVALVLAGVLSRDHGWLPRASAVFTAVIAVAFTLINPDARIAERPTPALATLPNDIAALVLSEQRHRPASEDGLRA